MGVGTAIRDLDDAGLLVPQIRDADFRAEGKRPVGGHHCMGVESDAARRAPLVELLAIPGSYASHLRRSLVMKAKPCSRMRLNPQAVMPFGGASLFREGRGHIRAERNKAGDTEEDRRQTNPEDRPRPLPEPFFRADNDLRGAYRMIGNDTRGIGNDAGRVVNSFRRIPPRVGLRRMGGGLPFRYLHTPFTIMNA